MIGSDVLTRVQRQFGDESGVQITEMDIIRWINDAQREIGQAQEIIETVATSASVADQSAYSIPTDIITLKRVTYKGKAIKALSMQEYDRYITDFQPNPETPETASEPEIFYVYGSEINFWPTPTADGDNIKLYYSQFPAEIVLISDPLTLPIKYDNRIVEYCLQQAYELDENFDAAAFKQGQMSGSLQQMREDASWTSHETYPTITVLPGDL